VRLESSRDAKFSIPSNTYRTRTRPNDRNNSYARRNACPWECTSRWCRSIRHPGSSARFPRTCDEKVVEINDKSSRFHESFYSRAHAIHRLPAIKSVDEPEGVHVEAVTPLLIDGAETAASGGIPAIVRVPAYRHILVNESDAHLVLEAIVAISRSISVPTRGIRFRLTCRRRSRPRK